MGERQSVFGAPPGLAAADTARLFEQHPLPMLLIDPSDGRIVDANAAAVEYYGWPLGQLRAMSVRQINTMEPADIHAEMQRAHQRERSTFVFRHRTASGAIRDVEVHSGPVTVEGRPLLHSVIVDVTERNEAVAAVQASEELASSIVEHAPLGIAVTDLDGHLIRVNAALCEIAGRTEGELVGRHYVTLSHPDDRPATLEAFRQLHRGELPAYAMEKRYVRGDGSVAEVEVASALLRDAAGRPRHQLGIVQDVSERAALQQSLSEKMAQESALAELSQQAVAERDIDALGASAVATLRDVLDAEDAALLRLIDGGQALATVARVGAPAPDGEPHRLTEDALARAALDATGPVLAGAVPEATRPGGPVAATAVPGRVRDWGILEVRASRDRHLSEDELRFLRSVADVLGGAIGRRDAEDQLLQAQKLEAIGRLAGSVAHDMNNVLTTILGQAELLDEGDVGPADLAHGLAQIREAGQRGAAVTRRILAFSRAQSTGPEPVEVAGLLEGLRSMLEAVLGEDVRLSLDVSEAWVRVDRRELEQAVLNLAVNARDAMPDGGAVTVIAGPVEGAVPTLVRVSVADSGSGMDAETRQRATEAFYTTKSADQGTGLGLAMVDDVATSAGGTVTIDSAPGAGTVVRVDLPACLGDDRDPGEQSQPAPSAPAAAVIVLVEDEESVRALAQRVLETAGHTVIPCADAETALARIEARGAPGDLLVTDTTMPGMSGPELAAEVQRRWPALPVLVTSGHPDPPAPSDRPRLAKPFGAHELLDAVEAVLGARG